MVRLVALLAFLLPACSTPVCDSGADTDPGSVDQDGDGWAVDVDCDDSAAAVYPSAEEACNGIDDDCDGEIDETAPTTAWYADVDGDGYGDDASAESGCDAPDTAVFVGGDCNDADATIVPGASDICDGIDNDCDGDVDGGVQVPSDFAALQDAVDAAADGDTISPAWPRGSTPGTPASTAALSASWARAAAPSPSCTATARATRSRSCTAVT